MEPNVGGSDRAVRIGLGVLATLSATALVAYGGGLTARVRTVTVGAILVFAVVMFVTAALRRCPVNAALGWNTRRL
jgi:hypothetical protein